MSRNARDKRRQDAAGNGAGRRLTGHGSGASPGPAPRSFRLVCAAPDVPRVEALLRAQGYEFEPEPFSPFCRRLLAGPRALGLSLAAFFGYIYIQDRSSMLPPLALAPQRGAAVLDICASPGSKSGFLAQLAGPEGLVLANEPNPARLATLRANLHQANLLQAATCSRPGERLDLAPGSWQAILLDPPCSGWGTAQKHPRTLTLWQGDKVQTLVRLQRRLLRHAASLLAPGGRLVYSTCTTNEAENEAQVRFAEDELGLVRENLAPFPGFVWEERPGGAGTLRVDGARSAAQGFYIASLRKPGADAAADHSGPAGLPADGLPPDSLPPDALFHDVALPPRMLAGPCCDPGLLPPGLIARFGDQVRFLPGPASALVPAGLAWQGALLGRMGDYGHFVPAPRLRRLLPRSADGRRPADEAAALVLEDVAEVEALLAGQSRQTGLAGRAAALWWRDVPLGSVTLRQGRAVAGFR